MRWASAGLGPEADGLVPSEGGVESDAGDRPEDWEGGEAAGPAMYIRSLKNVRCSPGTSARRNLLSGVITVAGECQRRGSRKRAYNKALDASYSSGTGGRNGTVGSAVNAVAFPRPLLLSTAPATGEPGAPSPSLPLVTGIQGTRSNHKCS